MRPSWRFVALAVFVLATSLWAGLMLRRLGAVQMQAAAMRGVQARPVAGGDPVTAIRAGLAGAAVTVERLAAAGREGGYARAAVTLVGPELVVRRAIGRIETGRPAVRFGTWRLTAEPGSADRVRFEGVGYARAAAVAVVSGAPQRRLFGGGVDDPRIAEAGASDDAPVVMGVVGRLPDAAVALVRDAQGRSRSVAVGGVSGGWRLEGLAADSAVFSRGGARVRVRVATVGDSVRSERN